MNYKWEVCVPKEIHGKLSNNCWISDNMTESMCTRRYLEPEHILGSYLIKLSLLK